MILFKDYVTFNILGQEINLYANETDYGLNTVAEINNIFHYLGNEQTNVATAIFVWQELNNKELNDEEMSQVLKDNGLS